MKLTDDIQEVVGKYDCYAEARWDIDEVLKSYNLTRDDVEKICMHKYANLGIYIKSDKALAKFEDSVKKILNRTSRTYLHYDTESKEYYIEAECTDYETETDYKRPFEIQYLNKDHDEITELTEEL